MSRKSVPSLNIFQAMIWFKSILIWICFIPIAILNGGLREYLAMKWNAAFWLLPLSSITLSLFIFLLAWLLLPRLGRLEARTYFKIGMLWVVLTCLFEFSFGLLTGNSWEQLWAAYNPLTGNWWILVLLTTGWTPLFVNKLSSRWRGF